jgi:NAD(P)-dependent dehydrogenase (short-subunit alcohol dehydrogenase family)
MAIKLKPLREQVLVVTGATSGNGLAIVEQATRRGAAVVAVARNEAALEALRARLSADGGRIAICVADVSDLPAVERVAAVATATFGGIDSWVNNAGIGIYGTLEQVPVEDHRRVFDVNYFGVLHGSLVAVRHLRRRGGGAIVNIGSILGDRAIVQQGPYCATKHAVQGLTDTLRMELEQVAADISVTLIKPGAIDTPFPEHARNFMDQPPRLPPPLYAPELVADAVLFACENPRRTLYVGGGGLMSSLLSRATPRIADKIMEVIGTPAQQKPGDAGDPTRRDNLYEPRTDALRGSQKVHARRSSTVLRVQQLPRPLMVLGMLGAGAAMMIGKAAARRR